MPSPKDNLPVAQMQEAERCRYSLNQTPYCDWKTEAVWIEATWHGRLGRKIWFCCYAI